MKRQHTQSGLTLVELLVAMALIGIVFAMITNWQVSTLNISTRTNATSQRLSDLTDVTGYVGDRVRSALRVRVATSGLTVNGTACSADRPCLAVVLPENTASGVITRYNLYVYRIDPRSLVNADDKSADTWAESNVAVLREYRSENSGSSPSNCVPAATATFETDTSAPCAAMRNLASASTLSSFGTYLVADYLTPADELGSGVAPFAYDATTKSVTLAFQTKQQVRGQTQLTPATPYTLTVQARNVP
ncbi:PulJ/GspJ family protein [Deinococcus budaensis]|uniref:Prepilin-type N-terminal cleavage/methylation domain-containing protein n=1 Tax=Deinococcus budaensis TaxID=1665626 RepID=A0A7W8GDY6_9DEIO|nr:type II secretion system protein [Deinococcus budaensis]MBB5233829.1 prepilin-type N-terminal cleavage/methylation domain-containing protein [Deinococcus budaensis]